MLVNEPVLIRTVVFWRLELATSVKNLGFPNDSSGKEPVAMQEMWVRSLDQEDSPEEGRATHSRILARKILWTEEPEGNGPWGRTKCDTIKRLSMSKT